VTSTRALRRHHLKRIAQARRKLAWNNSSRDYILSRSDNELATRHPFDCGRSCYLCHYEKKLHGHTRRQEGKRELADRVREVL
jgi:hypothetical protein